MSAAAEALASAREAREHGRWRLCQDHANRAAHLATAAGDACVVVPALLVSGGAAVARGAPGTALRTYRRALEVARAAAPEWTAPACHDVAVALALTGHAGGAAEMCERALRAYAPDDPRRVRVDVDRGAYLLLLGRARAAVDALSPLVVAFPPADAVGLHVRGNLALALAQAGAHDARRVDDFAAALSAHGEGTGAAWGWWTMARLAAAAGDQERARAACKTAARFANDRGERAVFTEVAALRLRLAD